MKTFNELHELILMISKKDLNLYKFRAYPLPFSTLGITVYKTENTKISAGIVNIENGQAFVAFDLHPVVSIVECKKIDTNGCNKPTRSCKLAMASELNDAKYQLISALGQDCFNHIWWTFYHADCICKQPRKFDKDSMDLFMYTNFVNNSYNAAAKLMSRPVVCITRDDETKHTQIVDPETRECLVEVGKAEIDEYIFTENTYADKAVTIRAQNASYEFIEFDSETIGRLKEIYYSLPSMKEGE